MPSSCRPVYQALIDEATRVAGAASGWLLQVTDNRLIAVAASGQARAAVTPGTPVRHTGTRAYVLSSAQPAAMRPHPNDPDALGTAGINVPVVSVLVVPCGLDEPRGVIELANKTNGDAFTFEDIDRVSSLGIVAGAALSETQPNPTPTITPDDLVTSLERLALSTPECYTHLAEIIRSMAKQAA